MSKFDYYRKALINRDECMTEGTEEAKGMSHQGGGESSCHQCLNMLILFSQIDRIITAETY